MPFALLSTLKQLPSQRGLSTRHKISIASLATNWMCGRDSDIVRLNQEGFWYPSAYQNHNQNASWRTSAYQDQAAMHPSSSAQSYGRGIPESLQDPRLDVLYRRALTSVPNSGSGDPLRRPRDAKPYTNPYMPRTVAYDPVATIPTTVTARSVTSKSKEQSIFEEEDDDMRNNPRDAKPYTNPYYSKNNPCSKKRMIFIHSAAQGIQNHIYIYKPLYTAYSSLRPGSNSPYNSHREVSHLKVDVEARSAGLHAQVGW